MIHQVSQLWSNQVQLPVTDVKMLTWVHRIARRTSEMSFGVRTRTQIHCGREVLHGRHTRTWRLRTGIGS